MKLYHRFIIILNYKYCSERLKKSKGNHSTNLLYFSREKNVKNWKLSERIETEKHSLTFRLGIFPHFMPCNRRNTNVYQPLDARLETPMTKLQ